MCTLIFWYFICDSTLCNAKLPDRQTLFRKLVTDRRQIEERGERRGKREERREEREERREKRGERGEKRVERREKRGER